MANSPQDQMDLLNAYLATHPWMFVMATLVVGLAMFALATWIYQCGQKAGIRRVNLARERRGRYRTPDKWYKTPLQLANSWQQEKYEALRQAYERAEGAEREGLRRDMLKMAGLPVHDKKEEPDGLHKTRRA